MCNFANLSDHVCSLNYALKYMGYNPNYDIGSNDTLYNISFENYPLKYNSSMSLEIMNSLWNVSDRTVSYRFDRKIDISIF